MPRPPALRRSWSGIGRALPVMLALAVILVGSFACTGGGGTDAGGGPDAGGDLDAGGDPVRSSTTGPSSSSSTSNSTAPTGGSDPTTPATVPGGGPIEPCRLAPGAPGAVGLGFPRSGDRLPGVGAIDVAVLFAEYADVPADRTPSEAFALVAPETSEFLGAMSYGRLEVRMHPHLVWLPLGPSTDYAAALRSFELHRDFLQEAVDLADPDFDFSEMEEVVVIGVPSADAVAYGPTWMGFDAPGGWLEADGARITNGVTSGADLTLWGWKWLPHELGHSFGLPDLYANTGSDGYTRPFGLMDLISSSAPEYLAYERWYLQWLDDDQIICVDPAGLDSVSLDPAGGGGVEALLVPIERPGGVKAMMVPLSGQRAVMVESRRAEGYDTALFVEGALVYVVDVAIPTFEGPIQVRNGRVPLKAGESVTVEGITVTVLEGSEDGDRVRITG